MSEQITESNGDKPKRQSTCWKEYFTNEDNLEKVQRWIGQDEEMSLTLANVWDTKPHCGPENTQEGGAYQGQELANRSNADTQAHTDVHRSRWEFSLRGFTQAARHTPSFKPAPHLGDSYFWKEQSIRTHIVPPALPLLALSLYPRLSPSLWLTFAPPFSSFFSYHHRFFLT